MTMVKRRKDQKLRLRNLNTRNERIETVAVVTSRRGLRGIERGKGVCYRCVQNRLQKPFHPQSHQHQEVDVRREKGASEAGVRLRSSIDSRAKTSRKVLALNYFAL